MPHEARGVATSTKQEGNIVHGGRSQKLAVPNDGQSEHDAVFHLPKRSQLMRPDLDREIKPLQPKQAVRCGDPLLPQGRRYGPDEGDSAKINTEPSQEAHDYYEHCPGSKSGVTHRQPSSKELEAGSNCDRKEASSNARVGKKSMGGRSDDRDNEVREMRMRSSYYYSRESFFHSWNLPPYQATTSRSQDIIFRVLGRAHRTRSLRMSGHC